MLDYSREFRVLATHLNFTAAALELNVSQPSLSRHITELERTLGFKLLERSPVELTLAGKFYLESVSEIIDHLDDTIQKGRAVASKDSPSLSVSAIAWSTPYMDVVYAGLAKLQEEYPSLVTQFHESRHRSIRESMECGTVDIGVVFDEICDPKPGYVCEKFLESHFAAWVHKDNPVLKRNPKTISDLADCYLVCSTNRQFSTWLDGMITACRRFGIEPKVHFRELNNRTDFILGLKTNEMMLSSDARREYDKINPNLVEINFEDRDCFYASYFYYNKRSENPVVQRFVDICLLAAE